MAMVRRGNGMGAAICERISGCSWQPGGYEATAQCPFGKSQVLCFYKPLFFHIPPNPPVSQKERALPRKTTNPELLSRVFIQQTLSEGCCWVSCSSWVGSHRCFLTGDLSHKGHALLTDTQEPSCSVVQAGLREGVWADLRLQWSTNQGLPRIYLYRHEQRV